ncbi:MAG: dienelactone hydrolase family protein [Planctomycetota bacterium]
MNRFHSSMSWNAASSAGSTDPETIKDESERGEFRLDDLSWSSLAAQRSFFLPLHFTSTYEYPLLVWLHSNGHNENQVDYVMPHISLRNYIAVGVRGTFAADSAGHRYLWRQSPASLAAAQESVASAIEEACDRYPIHTQRIVLAGYGMGGTMAMRIAMQEPQRFAGVVSLGGRFPTGSIRNVEQWRQRRMPMLWQWGRLNPLFSNDELKSDYRSLMTIGGQVEVRQYPGDDEMDTVVLSDLNDWIMRRIVSGSSIADSDLWATSPTQYSSN